MKKEIAFAAIVLAVVAMLIVPLPRPLLDGLLVLNIGAAVALLMAALLSKRPLSFASFPTLLVVTTLFRVGLEVSTARLILGSADAGDVVRAFGSSVVADNLVVGLVVFAVITIVQLVVVSRGAERVAEVAARFALDAMPGKQMAIDAELRAGAIDGAAAQKKRGDLERESQLYGAMDGAMRFVKGDAIAAIMIVIANLVGGIIVGVSRGMSAAQAMQTYSLLSIGAGLVAQIPSLIVAVASGMLVTRVASTGDRPLGDDLEAQLDPRVLGAAAVLLLGIGIVPGMPLVPFAALGVVAAGAAVAIARTRRPATIALDEPGAGPVTLRFAPEVHAIWVHRPAALHDRLAALRPDGVPPLAVVRDDKLIDNEIVVAHAGTPVAWITSLDQLPAVLAQLAPELLTVDRVAQLVERAALRAPVVVREVVPKQVSLAALAAVLRGLATEGVPIDDLPAILEAIALAPSKDPAALVEHLRGQLRRQISARWAPKGQLAVYTVDAMIEDAVRSAIDRREGGAVLALEPAIAQDIVAAVKKQMTSGVILVSGDVRRHLRSLLEPELPEIAILAAHELTPGTAVTTAGRIEV